MNLARKHDDESGAILVFSAIALVLMLGISALVIDIGYGHVEQRKLQNGADASALGSAQDLVPGSTPANVAVCNQGGTAQVQCDAEVIAQVNLPNANLPQGSAVWGSCAGTANSCVTFDTSFTQVTVKIPTQTYSTLFSGVFGINSISTSKTATAEIVPAGNTALLPMLVLNGFAGGEACLNGTGGSNGPCPPTEGNFGALDFHEYGNSRMGTTPSCDNGNQAQRLQDNIAMGADHFYGQQPDPNKPQNTDNCVNLGPYDINQGTGNGNAFDAGILDGPAPNQPLFSDGQPARLQRVPSSSEIGSWETTNVSGNTVDNKPLWEFIGTSLGPSVPQNCQRSVFSGQQSMAQMHWLLDRCIFEYTCGEADKSKNPNDALYTQHTGSYDCNPATDPRVGLPLPNCVAMQGCSDPVFTADSNSVSDINLLDIQLSPRFVYVPQVTASAIVCPGGSGSYCYRIQQFRAVFLQTLLGPQLDFEPGGTAFASSSPGNHKAEAVTGWVLPPSMLPGCIGAGPPTAACPNTSPIQIGMNATVRLLH